MKNNILGTILLLVLLGVFTVFIQKLNETKEVLKIYTPAKIGIDIDNNREISPEEIFCPMNIESFSLDVSDDFYKRYSKLYNLNKTDMISLGYLAQEFTVSSLLNKKVILKPLNKKIKGCSLAIIKVNGIDYRDILANSGFGIIDGEIKNLPKYKDKLKQARALNLVILNHHSNKYHTLDCKFGKLAHDTVFIPEQQLPKEAVPCKYCHQINKKLQKISEKNNFTKTLIIPNLPQPPVVISQGDITLYLTDFTQKLKPDKSCSTKICKKFIHNVQSANESIDIAIYGYDEIPEITNALKNAKHRGVKIRFVYDENFEPSKTYYKDNSIIRELAYISKSDKTSSKTQSDMLMHNKFIIFDNRTVFTGSMNFSPTGLSGYDQNDVIIINSKEIAHLYKSEFEQMLNGKFHGTKIKNSTPNIFKTPSGIIEIYFSPQDKSSDRIIQLIRNSKHYIYIPAFLITHTKISNELINARKRGVDVRVIIDANNVYTRNTKHKILRQNNILLKVENYAGKLHSKTMIIDDEYIIMGSMNFSNSGENKNDENLLIIQNQEVAKFYKRFFNYLWAKIPDKYLKYNPKPESFDSIGSCSDGVDNNFNGKIDNNESTCQKR